MLKVTRWSPDTCDCCLEYEWDDAAPELGHIFRGAVRKCAAHSVLNGPPLLNQVSSENRRKNRVFALAKELNPDITPDDYRFSFDADRNLVTDFKGKLNRTELASVLQRE